MLFHLLNFSQCVVCIRGMDFQWIFTVGFHQKYSDIKTPEQVLILKCAELNQVFSPPTYHSNFRRWDLQFVMSQIPENNFVVQTSRSL